MTSSELSDALNPYANQQRQGASVQNYTEPFQQTVTIPVHNYVPHQSGLEYPVPESHPQYTHVPYVPSEDYPISNPDEIRPMQLMTRPTRERPNDTINTAQEILRALNAMREAQEKEAQRRLAWEQEQEAKFRQKQMEVDQQIYEMRRQIAMLQSSLARSSAVHSDNRELPLNASMSPNGVPNVDNSHSSTGLFTPQYSMSPAVMPSRPPPQGNQPISPMSPAPHDAATYSVPHFVQGPSSNPDNSVMAQSYYDGSSAVGDYPSQQMTAPLPNHTPDMQSTQGQQYQSPPSQAAPAHVSQPPSHSYSHASPGFSQLQTPEAAPLPSQSVTPSPSPQMAYATSSASHNSPKSPARSSRKRSNAELDSTDNSSDSDSSASSSRYRVRRISHHDKRCLTIHHAMRSHFLRVMQLDADKNLPDSHVEGNPLGPNDPVRFVWDKTTKQSVHNSRMKSRVIADIKENRRLYKHVPHKDFSKKVLEAAFDQCFVTFRQKFKAQRDAMAAQNLKKREDAKARKARHLSRRKIKLSNRAESREKVSALEHVTFDGALQVECMSSEESEYEADASGNRICVLRTRGYEWRSRRLVRFFAILDDGDKGKPKRGVGKKERCVGPPKEGFHLPPKGVASWMISKSWLKQTQREHSDLPDVLRKLIEEPPGFDWNQLSMLGSDSEDETDLVIPSQNQQVMIHHPGHSHHPHHQATAYHMGQDVNINYGSQRNLPIPQQHYNASPSFAYTLPS